MRSKRDSLSLSEKSAAVSRIGTCRQILDRFGRSHAAGPAFKCLQFRKAADPRCNTREPHELTAIRTARRICGCVHGVVPVLGLRCSRHDSGNSCVLTRSALKSFQKGNDVRSLSGVEPKLRHVHVAGANSLDQCLLQAFDRIPPMQIAEWWRDLEWARAQFVGCVAGAAIGPDEGLTALLVRRASSLPTMGSSSSDFRQGTAITRSW